jgi:hypothetical protein
MEKFGYLRRKLGLKRVRDQDRKFILIMIDALGYNTLKDVKNEYMPFLSKLVRNYNLTPYNVGIPSTTPYVQAGLFYNYDEIIPGFRVYDKKNRKRIVIGSMQGASFIEERLKKRSRGILYNGSSLGNVFSAGAKRTLFTFTGMQANSSITNVRDVLSVVFVNPFSFFRVAYFSIKDFFVEVFENLRDNFKKKKGDFVNFSMFYPYFPFFRLGINAFTREVLTEAAILEMKRNVSRIGMTFHGYDWVSHYRGPRKKSSLSVLKEIDKKLEWLYKTARKEGYDFYVYSDHDIVPGLPFDKLYNQSLSEFITRVKEGKREVRDGMRDYIVYKLKYLHENFSLPLRAASGFLLKFFRVSKKRERIKEIEVHNSSCISHVYFSNFEKRLSLDEIEKYYPGIVNKLVNHEGVGVVICKGKDGMNVFGDLSKYGDVVKLKKWLKKIYDMDYFGDLFIMGAIKNGKIVTFEDFHMGTHDGFGLEMHKGFFVSKKKYDFSDSDSVKVLHSIFKDY